MGPSVRPAPCAWALALPPELPSRICISRRTDASWRALLKHIELIAEGLGFRLSSRRT
jgi:hypothetical protein